jgi:thiol-disulfide isomerase/thioredoxin
MIYPNNVEEMNEYVTKGDNVFFFTADWCPDCTVIKPVMPEIEAVFPQFSFVEVDRDKFLDLAGEWNIMGIPSFVVTKEGKEIDRYVDKFRKTKEQIVDFLTQAVAK